ncbi:hypothetical protein FHS31_000836 [Sphingomonas vulcanisoli]|uniref:Phage tail protein n=1 Tax=Sphingomonas vulcanisoli TaxID=1658060 RepID=A0ABX0TTZ0_9SPHN|nr:phage tail tube protein [Sphingomonas vulcanisoli]NIJ07240.1 hypothetical protein [Sphingomonas vulcanisoli]
MADSQRLAGTAYVAVNGQSYSIVGQGTYQVSGSSREPLNGQDGFHGYSETQRPGKISWQGRDGSATKIAALNDTSNATVTLALANGKTIIARNATRMGEPLAVNSEDATFEVEFISPDVTEN